jgi:hypothetical protein
MAEFKLKVKRVVLVYQVGIANVFEVSHMAMDPHDRCTRHLYQGDFRSAESIAIGLKLAGTMVTSMACNMLGDIRECRWDTEMDEAPFSDKFHPVFSVPE